MGMKVAMVGGDDVFADGTTTEIGIGESFWQFAAAMADRGQLVTAHSRFRGERNHQAAETPFRPVVARVGPADAIPPREVLPYVGEWAAELEHAWSQEPPDVVHAFGWLGGLAAQLAARRHPVPTVQSFHGLAASTEVERARIEPLLVRNASWVTGGSPAEVDVLTRLRRSRARLSVLPTGVEMNRYDPARPAENHGGFMRVVQLEQNALPCSGFDRAIQALTKVAEVELVIGETSVATSRTKRERAGLKRLATKLGVSDRVRFVGTVAPEDIPSLLQSADVVACTPRQAPRATTALQAMASGVAVVAVAVGALIDTIINGVTGIVVPPDNPRELSAALKSLKREGFLRQSMGSAGRSRTLSRFTWDRIALDALNIYHQADSSHQPRQRSTAGRTKFSARS